MNGEIRWRKDSHRSAIVAARGFELDPAGIGRGVGANHLIEFTKLILALGM